MVPSDEAKISMSMLLLRPLNSHQTSAGDDKMTPTYCPFTDCEINECPCGLMNPKLSAERNRINLEIEAAFNKSVREEEMPCREMRTNDERE